MKQHSKVIIPIALCAIVAIATGYSIFRVRASELSTTSLLNDANLKAYYKLESDGTDQKGNNLTIYNTPPTFAAAKYGNGMDLGTSNTSTYAEVASNLGLNSTGALSISAWVKMNSSTINGGTWGIAGVGIQSNYVEYEIKYYGAGPKQVVFTRSCRRNSRQALATVVTCPHWERREANTQPSPCSGSRPRSSTVR